MEGEGEIEKKGGGEERRRREMGARRREEGRGWMKREEAAGEGSILDSEWRTLCPRPRVTHSENGLGCSLFPRMILPHSENIFIKMLQHVTLEITMLLI